LSKFFNSKRNVIIVALTVFSAIAIGCMSAFMITAIPDDEADSALAIRNGSSRLTSPFSVESTSLSAFVPAFFTGKAPAETAITSLLTVLPEVTETTEAEDEYTTVTAEALTALSPATREDEETEVETEVEAEVIAEPEIEPEPEEEVASIIPKMPDGLLADDAGVAYEIVTPSIHVPDDELYYVATLIQLEVMGSGSNLYSFENVSEKYFEMLAVAQTVRNRMENRKFPNTAHDVIFQSYTYANGYTVYQFIPKETVLCYEPTYEAIVAAYEVLREGVTVLPSNYYYFCASNICDRFESINCAVFARKEDGSFDKIDAHETTFYGSW